MKKYNLFYISDKNLYNHVKETVLKYSCEMNLKIFNKNIIDPIKLTFDSIVYQESLETTIKREVFRQLDKSNSNFIGYFHQNIFKYISSDWNVLPHGYDIVNNKDNIFVEMKNKHNTMNSSSSAKTHIKMMHTLLNNSKAKCYLVEVIAKHSQNIPWIVSIDGERQESNERLRRVSIDKFYEIVTGDRNAFKDLCQILPVVISDVVDEMGEKHRNISVFEELLMISPDLIKSLYLLSFKDYEGFNELDIKL